MSSSLSPSLRLFEAGYYEQSFTTALDQLKSYLLDVNTKLSTTEGCWELEDLSRHFFDLMIEIFLHDDSQTKEEKEKRMEQIDEVDELRILSRYGLCDTNYYYNVLRYISEEHIQGLEKVIELKWNPISSTQYQLKIYRYCISRNDAESALNFIGKHINILRLVHEELAQWLEKSANRSFTSSSCR